MAVHPPAAPADGESMALSGGNLSDRVLARAARPGLCGSIGRARNGTAGPGERHRESNQIFSMSLSTTTPRSLSPIPAPYLLLSPSHSSLPHPPCPTPSLPPSLIIHRMRKRLLRPECPSTRRACAWTRASVHYLTLSYPQWASLGEGRGK